MSSVSALAAVVGDGTCVWAEALLVDGRWRGACCPELENSAVVAWEAGGLAGYPRVSAAAERVRWERLHKVSKGRASGMELT